MHTNSTEGAPPHQPQSLNQLQQRLPAQAMVYQGTSGLEVTTGFMFLQWMLYFTSPVVEINGQPHKVPWGRRFAPLAPGQYNVRIYFPWITGKGCLAETHVEVHSGYITGLRYDTAFFVFSRGVVRNLGVRPMTA